MTLLLELTSLRYAYGERLAVRDISFEIKSGQVFGLLGPNGAGKTTTLSCISGALSKWSGSIYMNGNPFFPAREAKHRGLLGIAPQELAVYDTLTARENLILVAKLCGVPRHAAQHDRLGGRHVRRGCQLVQQEAADGSCFYDGR